MRVLQLRVPESDVELASDRLWSAGARAVEECDASDGSVSLRTVLAAADDQSVARLGSLLPAWVVSFFDVDDEPAQTWREFAVPIRVSPTLTLAPAWQRPVQVSPTVLTVAIEPGGAFGLGDHPTTRLSAAAAERSTPVGGSLLDVGCGTGVLAIIGALRGASVTVAIDIAEAAVEATVGNARRNGVAHIVSAATTPVEDVMGPFDLVMANILAPALVAMASSLRSLTAARGSLVISGVLVGAFDHVVRALEPMVVVRVDELDGWAAVELRHPS